MADNPWTNSDRVFMTRALQLARRGVGQVEPNPAVGAVLVRNHKIIGQGFHRFFGAPHAEVAALDHARAQNHRVKGSTLYVTLEPCCHWGKTPPCTDALIAAGIAKVIAAVTDPSSKVAGKGLAALKQAGIEVRVGLMAAEAKNLNPWFFKFHQKHQPWIIGKWAQTLDGKLAARSGRSRWISSPDSRQQAHKLRQTCQAIVVGVQTVLADDPQLTVRLKSAPRPRLAAPNRVVFDTHLRTPLSSNLVQTADKVPTWIVTSPKASRSRLKALENRGVHVACLALDKNGKIDLSSFLKFAARHGWTRILVEGGATLLSSFILARLADELVVFMSGSLAFDAEAIQLTGQKTQQVNDFIKSYKLQTASIEGDNLILRLLRV